MKYLDNPIIPYIFFLFYLFHQLIMPEETSLQTLAIAAFLSYAVIAACKLHQGKCHHYIIFMDIFLIIQLLYFMIQYPSLSEKSQTIVFFSINQIKSVLIVMMPMYTYMWYGLRGKLTKQHIIWFSVVFIGLSIPQFYYLANYLMENTTWVMEYNETTNNIAYYFLQGCIFLPLIAEKKKLSIAILLIIVFYLLLGVKRGAILCFICMLPFYLRFFLKKSRVFVIPLIILVFILAANWFVDYFSDMIYMQTRIEQTLEGNVSSRDVIYSKILNHMFGADFSIFALLFGHGFNESVNIVGNLAHNDWLELLSGFGLLSIFVYLGIMINVLRIRNRTQEPDVKVCLTIGLVIWILQTFFSMAYASTSFQFIIISGLCGISLRSQYIKTGSC